MDALCDLLPLHSPKIMMNHASGKGSCPRSRAGRYLGRLGDAGTFALALFGVLAAIRASSSAWVCSMPASQLSFHFLMLMHQR